MEQPSIQPELVELLARQLDRCGPANLTVPVCGACPPPPADNTLLLLLAGAVAGFSLGVACTLLWTLLPCCEPVRAPAPVLAVLPPPGLAAPPAVEASPAALGRRRAAPGSAGLATALRDLA